MSDQRHLALLRGVNVGGKSLLSMAALRVALEQDGFSRVQTYIQSGNVLFDSSPADPDQLAQRMEASLEKHFGITTRVAIFSDAHWRQVVADAPPWWGQNKEWKHNLLVLLKPYDMHEALAAIGLLKPDIEAVQAGEGVIYQSMSLKLFGRTTTGKLATNPLYKQLTIRNYNTTHKLLGLLSAEA
jgi:uncharacterized protein (DUF1697 family)